MTIAARILDGVMFEPNSGCWLWERHIKNNGYGTITIKDGGRWLTKHAHRVSFQAFVGPVPDGLDLDHKCRVRSCVNPDHLEPVTRSVNLSRSPIMNRQLGKAHCPAGHLYSGLDNRGARICHKCLAANAKAFRERKANERRRTI